MTKKRMEVIEMTKRRMEVIEMTKRIVSFAIVISLMFGAFSLSGCTNSHGIPNGKYGARHFTEETSSVYYLLPKNAQEDYFLRIRGNKAIWYASNQKSSERKIIKEGDKVFFVKYDGDEEIHRVRAEYNEISKEIVTFAP